MNTKATILALSALLCGATHAADVLEGDFATITIGTNTYTNAHLRAYSAEYGSLRHDGGTERVKLADLPEPARSKFYDPQKAEADKSATERAAVERKAQAAAASKAASETECLLACKRLSLPYHPYRKVGDQYYDLHGLYEQLAHKRVPGTFPEWFTACEGPWNHYTVMQITSDGLLVEHRRTILNLTGNGAGNREESLIYFLANYPFASSVVDGHSIAFIARRAGRHRYTDVQGATRTIEAFDYGIPCDPPKSPGTDHPAAP
jgi:hypothetical protein